MIRLFSLAWLALIGLSCSGVSFPAGVGEESPEHPRQIQPDQPIPTQIQADQTIPRQIQARQLIVTLAPATQEVWAGLARDLSSEYGLGQVGAFPLTSLGVQCVVFHVTDDRPLNEVLAQLRVDPRVESVQLNQIFRDASFGLHYPAREGYEIKPEDRHSSLFGLQARIKDPYGDLQYGAREVRADHAHAWVTGRGVRVAVIDTGVDTDHPDLKGRIGQTINFVEGGEKTFTSDRHGTAVAGVIGARAGNQIGIFGIAPDADLVAAKACWHPNPKNAEARCSSWTLAKAIDFAIIERVKVLNLSLAGPTDPLLARLILKAVEEQGITVIAAVMGVGGKALSFPASLSTVVAVGASGPNATARAPVANGPVLLSAPGVEVLTTVPQGAYDFLSGSSFAAAHVSGIVALLLEQNPQLSPRDVKHLLLATARPGLKTRSGSEVPLRLVDACAALQRLVDAVSCP